MPSIPVRYVIAGDSAGAVRAFAETAAAAEDTGAKIAASAQATKGRVASAAESIGGIGSKLGSAGSRLTSIGNKVSNVGHSLARVSLPVAAVGGYAIKSAVDFQSSMKLIQTQARASASETAQQSRNIMGLAANVVQSPTELAEGLYPIESVGIRGAKAYEALKAASIGAAVGHDTMAATSNAMAAAMKTHLRDVHSATEAMGMMDAIVGHGKMVLPELTEAMSSGIMSTAHEVGLGMKSVGAALDVMTSRGVPARQAATRLRTDLIRAIAPSAEAAKALRSIGLEQFSLAKALNQPNGLVKMIDLLKTHMDSLSKYKQNALLSEMFGKSKGASTVFELMAGGGEMASLIPKLKSHLLENYAHTQETAAFKLKHAWNEVRVALVQLGQVLIPIVVPVLEKIAHVVLDGVRAFSHLPKPIKDIIVGLGLMTAIGGPALIMVGHMISAAGGLLKVLGFLAQGILLVAKTLVTLSTAFVELMVANPLIAGIIAGVVLLGVAVYMLVTHFKLVKKTLLGVFKDIAQGATWLFDTIVNGVISGINLIIKAIDLVIKGYNDIPGFLRPTGKIGEIALLHDIGTHPAHHPRTREERPHEIHIHTKVYLDHRSARPLAEATTRYAVARAARSYAPHGY